MNNGRLAKLCFAGSITLCLIQIVNAYGILPARVASHFNGAGLPNGWTSKEFFLAIYLVVILIAAVSLTWGSSCLLRLPSSRINLPNKDFWLSPENRQEASDLFSAYLFFFGAATFVLLFDIFRQVIRFNIGKASSLEHPMLSLGVYLGFVAAWNVMLIRRFRKAEIPNSPR